MTDDQMRRFAEWQDVVMVAVVGPLLLQCALWPFNREE